MIFEFFVFKLAIDLSFNLCSCFYIVRKKIEKKNILHRLHVTLYQIACVDFFFNSAMVQHDSKCCKIIMLLTGFLVLNMLIKIIQMLLYFFRFY